MKIQVRLRRMGTREYKINHQGFVVLRCELEPGGRTVKTEPCCFCGIQHIHGLSVGHKARHCPQDIDITLPDGRVISNFNGYFLKLVKKLKT